MHSLVSFNSKSIYAYDFLGKSLWIANPRNSTQSIDCCHRVHVVQNPSGLLTFYTFFRLRITWKHQKFLT